MINYVAAYRKTKNEDNLKKYHIKLSECRLKYQSDIVIFETLLAEKAQKRGVTLP